MTNLEKEIPMLYVLSSFLFVALFTTHVFAATKLPVYRTDSFGSRPLTQSEETRLRIVLSGEGSSVERQVRLGNISVCSDSACYQAASQQYFDLDVPGNGNGQVVADIVVPIVKIRSVSFESLGGDKLVEGQVMLSEPFQLERDVAAAELLIVLEKKKRTERKISFVATSATASHFSESRTSIYYNPKFGARVQLNHGASLAFPLGATERPQIFSVTVHDTGGKYPVVDIFPEMELRSGAELTLNALVRQPRAVRSDQSQDTPQPEAPMKPGTLGRNDAQQGARTVILQRTGVVRDGRLVSVNTDESEPSSFEQTATNSSVWWSSCVQVLSHPASEPTFTRDLAVTGTIQINWCETVSPYVHITITNLRDAREVFSIPSAPKVWVNNILQTPLRRITNWAPNTQVLVNGFTWEGGRGTTAIEYGRPLGYVTWWNGASSIYLGSNRVGGGVWTDYPGSPAGTPGGRKFLMYKWPVSNTDFSWVEASSEAVYHGTTVSSSTSVMKYGSCTGDTTVDRWSAIGTTPGGRIVVMSSTSGSQTSAAALCSSFQALGVNNAIRLDGGASAAMTIDGVHRNPLTGTMSFVFGDARHIPYPLKIAWPGW